MLRVQADHHDRQHDERVAEKPRRPVAQQPDQPDDPNRRQEEIRQQQLLEEIEPRPGDDVLAVLTVTQQLPHRKAVQRLP